MIYLNILRIEDDLNVKSDNLNNMGVALYQEIDGEEYMNDKQLAHIEKILLAWRQSLMEEVDRTVSHLV